MLLEVGQLNSLEHFELTFPCLLRFIDQKGTVFNILISRRWLLIEIHFVECLLYKHVEVHKLKNNYFNLRRKRKKKKICEDRERHDKQRRQITPISGRQAQNED